MGGYSAADCKSQLLQQVLLFDILQFFECLDIPANHREWGQTSGIDAAKHEFSVIPDKNTNSPIKEKELSEEVEEPPPEQPSRHKSTPQRRRKSCSVDQLLAASPCLYLFIGFWAYLMGGF
jgi:hypothetical protein